MVVTGSLTVASLFVLRRKQPQTDRPEPDYGLAAAPRDLHRLVDRRARGGDRKRGVRGARRLLSPDRRRRFRCVYRRATGDGAERVKIA